MDIEANLLNLRHRIARACERRGRSPQEVTLVAVTKGVGLEAVAQAHRAGVRHFGENRVQEAQGKLPALGHLSPPPTWHMVGHLQTNKAKLALSLFQWVDSVDSVRLAQALDGRAGWRLPILLEVNLSGEATKFGLAPEEVGPALKEIAPLPHLELRGLMTVAPVAPDPETVRPIFRRLRELRDALGLRELSMGMSEDFEVAVEEGATMVRIGRALFGYERRGK